LETCGQHNNKKLTENVKQKKSVFGYQSTSHSCCPAPQGSSGTPVARKGTTTLKRRQQERQPRTAAA
jgi:hypothetical protein